MPLERLTSGVQDPATRAALLRLDEFLDTAVAPDVAALLASVADLQANKVSKSGDTMTGALTVQGNVTVGGTGESLRIRDTVDNSHQGRMLTANLTANRNYTFPNESGTVALTGGLRQVIYYTSVGTATFSKATYPWLRAVRVRVQAGGGGGGGAAAITTVNRSSVAGGGGGGAYAESFLLESAVPASVTVTVGAGGARGAAGNNAGGAGGPSSFGSLVSAGGGGGGDGNFQSANAITAEASGGTGGSAGTGQLVIPGHGGDCGFQMAAKSVALAKGGRSFLGGTTAGFRVITAVAGQAGTLGSGGTGAATTSVVTPSQPARRGGRGGAGIVIVELYA